MTDEKTTLGGTIEALRNGTVTAERVAKAHLEQIEKVDPSVEAWAFIDPDYVLKQARAVDRYRADGKAMGPLHGVPVGVKDIFDTFDMPTEDGTVLHAGRRPDDDSTVVSLLREAGAVIMGKTVTTELATFAPGKTKHPADPARTPGGSSSGSAAAVATGMVPLAIGSQTNGSVIRPASFCGVVGFKPTSGLISRRGMLSVSQTLDQVGVFAPTIADAALLAEVLMSYDPHDSAMRPQARPDLNRVMQQDPPLPPKLAFVRTPIWDEAEEDTRAGFDELVEMLGERVREQDLPDVFDEAHALHATIQDAELAVSLNPEYEGGRDRLSEKLCGMVENGRAVRATDYVRAKARIGVLNSLLGELFDYYDAIITPAAPGEAPGIETTGSPRFCTIWSLLGLPAISLPLLSGKNGLPIGVQLVGKRGDDARLLRTARWLWEQVAADAG